MAKSLPLTAATEEQRTDPQFTWVVVCISHCIWMEPQVISFNQVFILPDILEWKKKQQQTAIQVREKETLVSHCIGCDEILCFYHKHYVT